MHHPSATHHHHHHLRAALDPRHLLLCTQVARELQQAGARAVAVGGDITAEGTPEAIVRAAADSFGRIDVIINNAGFTWDGVIHKMSSKQWDTMLAVHCTAPFKLVQAAAPYMRDAGKAEAAGGSQPGDRCIINISSTSGTHGNSGQANYATAKAGMVGLTKTIAKEWGPCGVRWGDG
jgi:3-oxoacyl-[acyl-carrier protein] reductase